MTHQMLQAIAVASYAASEGWQTFWTRHQADVERLEITPAQRRELIRKRRSLVVGERRTRDVPTTNE